MICPAERVAIGICVGDGFVAYNPAGARLVFNYNRLAEFDLHEIRKDAANNVSTSAGSERHDDADRFLRPVFSDGVVGKNQHKR